MLDEAYMGRPEQAELVHQYIDSEAQELYAEQGS